jgi:hypothetical protein
MAKKGKRKGGKRYVRPLVLGRCSRQRMWLSPRLRTTPEARTGPGRCRQPLSPKGVEP